MTEAHKYQIYIAVIIIGFLYVLGTEVTDRWTATYSLFTQLREKQQAVLNPDELEAKKLALIQRKRSLTSVLTKDTGKFEQSLIGEFEFLNSCASKAGIRFESLVPVESESSDRMGFKIHLKAGYHRVGTFIDEVENGELAVQVKRLELASAGKGVSQLDVNLEGVGFIYSTKQMP